MFLIGQVNKLPNSVGPTSRFNVGEFICRCSLGTSEVDSCTSLSFMLLRLNVLWLVPADFYFTSASLILFDYYSLSCALSGFYAWNLEERGLEPGHCIV